MTCAFFLFISFLRDNHSFSAGFFYRKNDKNKICFLKVFFFFFIKKKKKMKKNQNLFRNEFCFFAFFFFFFFNKKKKNPENNDYLVGTK